jgi:hypothetical protein
MNFLMNRGRIGEMINVKMLRKAAHGKKVEEGFTPSRFERG